jgi:aspartyl-tRNA(Asn)/glutamyl-tRNA(Gln) amidotransferase subunit C
MNKEEVLKLAQLARIEVSEEEAENLTKEFSSILGYVGEIKGLVDPSSLDLEPQKEDFPQRNILRDDELPHEGGIYTDAILGNAPSRTEENIKVKKIL